MKIGEQFRIATGKKYEIIEINNNEIWASDVNGKYIGGVSKFEKKEVEFWIKYWKQTR